MASTTDSKEQNSQVRTRKARRSDLDVLAEVLTRAYDKDLLMNWIVLQDEKRTQRMQKYFEITLKDYAMKYDHVFTVEELSGVAIWYPPEPRNCWKASIFKHLSLLHKWISIAGLRRFLTLFVADEMVTRNITLKHHTTISLL